MEYTLRRSLRAKHLRIAVHKDTRVIVTVPKKVSDADAHAFLTEKKEWIIRAVARMREQVSLVSIPQASHEGLTSEKARALLLVERKLTAFNKAYNFSWNTITIKNTRTRWGSCSRQRNLSFNYRIVYLPEELQNYLVVHELCHLGAFDHSKAFWNLVEKTIPNYKELRKNLRRVQ